MTRKTKTTYKTRRATLPKIQEQRAVYEVDAPPIAATDHPNIIRVEGVRGGEPITRFSYISVRIIVEGITRLGETPEQVCRAHSGLSYVELSDALSYYLHHTKEIETYIAEHDAVSEMALSSRRKSANDRERKRIKENGGRKNGK